MSLNKDEQYTMAIMDTILSLFRDQEEDGHPIYHFELDNIDATEFFTSMVTACGLIYNRLTDEDMDILDYTHLANKLAVQKLLEEVINSMEKRDEKERGNNEG